MVRPKTFQCQNGGQVIHSARDLSMLSLLRFRPGLIKRANDVLAIGVVNSVRLAQAGDKRAENEFRRFQIHTSPRAAAPFAGLIAIVWRCDLDLMRALRESVQAVFRRDEMAA